MHQRAEAAVLWLSDLIVATKNLTKQNMRNMLNILFPSSQTAFSGRIPNANLDHDFPDNRSDSRL
jgi:hypothetical protein